MATSREQRSAIFQLLGQIDQNIKNFEAKKSEFDEIDGKDKKDQETSDSSDSGDDILDGFLQGYNETNHEDGRSYIWYLKQRSTEGTIFGCSRSRSWSHKTFGFWPKAVAESEGANYNGMRGNYKK